MLPNRIADNAHSLLALKTHMIFAIIVVFGILLFCIAAAVIVLAIKGGIPKA